MKKLVLASAVAMALSAFAAHAGEVTQINPDGAGGDPILSVGLLDWATGNALSIGVGSPELLQAALDSQTPFQTYTHARLATFNDAGGNPIGGVQLNGPTAATNYEWTYVSGFQEIVSALTNTTFPYQTASFQTVAGGDNFFEIYYDTTPDSNNLTGLGFNDGLLILSGTVLPFNALTGEGGSNFETTGGCTLDAAGLLACGDFDTFNNNDYPAIDSPTGKGGTNLAIAVSFAHSDYFLSGMDVMFLSFDSQQNLPFDQQNPSACFSNGAGALVNGAGGQGTNCTNSVGAINGISGRNVMFITDSNSGFAVTSVPEPASLALLGAGLIGFGLARRRKNQA